MNNSSITWPSAIVALGVIAAVATMATVAVIHYQSVDDALKFWSALSGLVGIITGAMVTYFFSRGTVQAAQDQAQTASAQATAATSSANTAKAALGVALLGVDPDKGRELMANPAVASALSG
jgi:hypothetical protein